MVRSVVRSSAQPEYPGSSFNFPRAEVSDLHPKLQLGTRP